MREGAQRALLSTHMKSSTTASAWVATARLWFGLISGVAPIPAVVAAPPRPSPADELFTNSIVPHLRIQLSPEAIEALRAYEWTRGGNTSERTNVLGTVREGDRVYTNVAIHLKGAAGSFRTVDDKPALTLNFNKHAKGQRFHGLAKIHLNNSVQDQSYICEQLAREMFNAAGVPAPRAAPATVSLNERHLGLYVLVEGWNTQFLKRHFSNGKGELWDGGFSQDIDKPLELNSGQDSHDHQRLKDLVEACGEPDPSERWTQLQSVLDLDRFITFSALEIMLCHWDGYSMGHNNYRVYHDPDSDRLVFLPHGLDQLFGVFRSSPESPIRPMMKSIVGRAVREVPQARSRYLAAMSRLLTNVFAADALTQRVDEIAARVRPALDPSQRLRHARSVDWLKDRIDRRARSVAQQIREAEVPIAFDASGEARLTDWQPRIDAGSPSFTRPRGAHPTLQVWASGTRAYGTWRTTVLLAPGAYRFVGRVRIEDLAIGPDVTRGGVTLRQSGERNAPMVTEAPEWTPISYEFTVTGLADLELLCELRASKGRAFFDANSLKLVRQGVSPNP